MCASWEANSPFNQCNSTENYEMLDSDTLCATLMLDSIEANTSFIWHYVSKHEDQVRLQGFSDSVLTSVKIISTFWGMVTWISNFKMDLSPDWATPGMLSDIALLRSLHFPIFPGSRRHRNGLLPWKLKVACHRAFLGPRGEVDKLYLTTVIIKCRRRK